TSRNDPGKRDRRSCTRCPRFTRSGSSSSRSCTSSACATTDTSAPTRTAGRAGCSPSARSWPGQFGGGVGQTGRGQARVGPAAGQQFGVGAPLDDPPLLQHQDQVGGQDGGKPVGDGEGGPANHQIGQRGLNQPLGVRVQRRGRLVQDQDARVL